MHNPKIIRSLAIRAFMGLLLAALPCGWAQEAKTGPDAAQKMGGQGGLVYDKPQAPAELPGKGLAQHDFLYAGQQGFTVAVVRGGKVVWSYHDPKGQGEISYAVMLSSGNILFTHAYGMTELSPDKTVVWNYDAPPKHEIHGAQPIGKDRVIFVQNGDPAKIIVANKVTGKFEREFTVPVGKPDDAHRQMRRARLTAAGTIVVAQTDLNKVAEFNENGQEVWSAKIDKPWSVERLANGNTLVCTYDLLVRELNAKGETVWEFSAADVPPGYVMTKWQVATRLSSGNTLINNEGRWEPGACAENAAPVQVFEVTPGKKIVWALRSWVGPNALTSSTTMQVLTEPGVPEGGHFGSIR